MQPTDESKQLREEVRRMERKLGILEDGQMCCGALTMAQCHALVEIGRAGSLSLGDLASLLNLDSSTTSRTVNNLVDRRMAKREQAAGDRRYVAIALTPAGTVHFREIESSMNDYFARIYAAIPEENRLSVLESLRVLLQAIEDSGCC